MKILEHTHHAPPAHDPDSQIVALPLRLFYIYDT
jgi:hypothetical protein